MSAEVQEVPAARISSASASLLLFLFLFLSFCDNPNLFFVYELPVCLV